MILVYDLFVPPFTLKSILFFKKNNKVLNAIKDVIETMSEIFNIN